MTQLSPSRCFSPHQIRKPLHVVAQVGKANAVHVAGFHAFPDGPEHMLNTTPNPRIGMVEGRLLWCQRLSPPTLEVDTGLLTAFPQTINRFLRAIGSVSKNLRITGWQGSQQLPEDPAVMDIRRCHIPIGYQLALPGNRYMVLVAVVIHTVLPEPPGINILLSQLAGPILPLAWNRPVPDLGIFLTRIALTGNLDHR